MVTRTVRIGAGAVSSLSLTAVLWAVPAAAVSDELAQLLSYESVVAQEISVKETRREGDIEISDIEFAGAAPGEVIKAYVVRPARTSQPLAGIVFIHWFSPPEPNSNRTQFFEEAEHLAARGTISLLISAFWSDTEAYRARRWQDDYTRTLQQARSVRRSIDVLALQLGVDASRMAVVGHDYGAMFAALVAAVDERVAGVTFIAGAPRFADWYLFGSATGVPTGADRASFLRDLSALDPISVMGGTKAQYLLQFGEHDPFTTRWDFISVYHAAPEPKRLITYDSDHDMSAEIVRADREDWLARLLRLPEASHRDVALGQVRLNASAP